MTHVTYYHSALFHSDDAEAGLRTFNRCLLLHTSATLYRTRYELFWMAFWDSMFAPSVLSKLCLCVYNFPRLVSLAPKYLYGEFLSGRIRYAWPVRRSLLDEALKRILRWLYTPARVGARLALQEYTQPMLQ
jgi:hypothetical protein